jgi:hypothetical protein
VTQSDLCYALSLSVPSPSVWLPVAGIPTGPTSRAVLLQWPRDFNARNLDAVCGLFADDAVLAYPGAPDRNRDAFCDQMRERFRDPSKTVSYDAPDIKSLGRVSPLLDSRPSSLSVGPTPATGPRLGVPSREARGAVAVCGRSAWATLRGIIGPPGRRGNRAAGRAQRREAPCPRPTKAPWGHRLVLRAGRTTSCRSPWR